MVLFRTQFEILTHLRHRQSEEFTGNSQAITSFIPEAFTYCTVQNRKLGEEPASY